jgi:CRISPR-associated protein Csm4
MQLQAYYLEARSPFHLGERGVGLEATEVMAHADTLFSALCLTCREWYGEAVLEELLNAFLTNPPFLLSSAFPYAELGGHIIRLYPRPQGMPPGAVEADHKKLKKVKWVSEEVFRQWIGGTLRIESTRPLQDGEVWLSREEAQALHVPDDADQAGKPFRLWESGEVPRVSVDRASSASQIYRAGRVRFVPGGGLWVAFLWRVGDWQDRVEQLLHVLGDAGMGGERSAGNGQFSVSGSDPLELPDPSTRFVNLATYWPRQDEIEGLLSERVAYTLIMRRGWMGSPEGNALRRKAVRMFGEGSVLNLPPNKAVLGGLADVTPNVFRHHRVYRYGYALPVGMEAV